jgi:hypothetical protein
VHRKLSLLHWVGRLAGIAFGLLLAWLLLEVALRVEFDHLPNDVQGAIQYVRKVPWEKGRIVPEPPWTADKDYQTILKPGLKNYRVGHGESMFHVDSISLWGARVGLRTQPPQWPVDLAVVGDSFTVCWTEEEACWVQRLHQDFSWSVMNLGLAGTGARSHLQVMKNFAIPLQPKVILWQWYGNDANDDYNLGLLRDEYPPLNDQVPLEAKPDFGKLAHYSAVYALLRDQWWTYKHGTPKSWGQHVKILGRDMLVGDEYNLQGFDLSLPGNELGWEQSVQALEEAERIAHDEMNAKMVIVLIPTKEEVYASEVTAVLGKEYLDRLQEGRLRMKALCEERHWHCLDLIDALQAEVNAGHHVYYAVDLHLDPHGNAVLADTVGRYLIDEGLLSEPNTG